MNRALGLGLLLSTTQLACVPDPVTAPTMSEGSHIPAITAERLQACMSEYGEQLDGQSYRVPATVKVNQDGRVVKVALDGMPLAAPDLAACARVALRDMAVPDSVLRLRPDEPPISQQQSKPARGMMGNILVLGGAIALGEIVAKAFGATLIFAVAVELVHEGIEAGRRTPKDPKKICNEKRTECLMTDLGSIKHEDVWQVSRCHPCRDQCVGKNGEWPSKIEMGNKFVSCEYWKPRWQREGN
jgi:hypothetical protein